jgi:hypothetical protein
MKKAALLPLFLVATLSLWAQQPIELLRQFSPKKTADRSGDFYVVDSLYCYSYDPATQAEKPTERQYNLDFTAEGEVLQSRKEQYLSWLGKWRYLSLTTSAYDNQHNLVEETTQRWDTLAFAWVNRLRTLNTPNQNGDYTEVLNQEWRNNTWRNVDKVTFLYDQFNHISTLEQHLWDTLANAWKKNLRIIYAVNAGGHITSTLFQLWDAQASVYKSLSRTFHSFDPQNQSLETEALTEVWDVPKQAWVRSSRFVKEYDANGNQTAETYQLWTPFDSTWLNVTQILLNYNAEHKPTLRTELNWVVNQWINAYQTTNFYDANGNLNRFEVAQWQGIAWSKLSGCDFYWRFHHETATAEILPVSACNLLNPYRPGDSFECPGLPPAKRFTLAIFDLSGKMVYVERIEPQNFIKIAAPLPAGLYVLTISDESQILHQQKVVFVH